MLDRVLVLRRPPNPRFVDVLNPPGGAEAPRVLVAVTPAETGKLTGIFGNAAGEDGNVVTVGIVAGKDGKELVKTLPDSANISPEGKLGKVT